MLTEPVNCCVLLREFPKIFDPELYTTLEETVWTFKVCAVIVLLTSIFDAVKFPPKEAVVAKDALPNKLPVADI